jgi:hypothetical protein
MFLPEVAKLVPKWIEIYDAAEPERDLLDIISAVTYRYAWPAADMLWVKQMDALVARRGPFDVRQLLPVDDYLSRLHDPYLD